MDEPSPLIGVSCCIREIESHDYHTVGGKYVDAAAGAVKGAPVLIPALGTASDDPHALAIEPLLERLDGVMLTGSPSNIEKPRYGLEADDRAAPYDPLRDDTVLPLIQAAIEKCVPVLAICRGIQELNVALGGTLLPHVQDDPARFDHRMRKDAPYERRYRPAHPIRCTGMIAALVRSIGGDPDQFLVNSLHQQAVDRLGDGLVAEAWAPDGTIEAIRLDRPEPLVLGVQWHPEFRYWEDPMSVALFTTFGDAARRRAAARTPPASNPGIAS